MAVTDDHAVDYKVKSINVATGLTFAGASGSSGAASTATPTVANFLAGTVVVGVPQATGAETKSASATVTGLTANHKVIVLPTSNLTTLAIVAAIAGANVLTVSANNTHTATQTAATATASFFAWV